MKNKRDLNALIRDRVRVYSDAERANSSDSNFADDFASLIPEELRFSKRDQECIAQSLLSPSEPTPALKRAFELLAELPDDFLVDRADTPPQARQNSDPVKKPTHPFFELGPVARELFIQSLVSNVVASNAIEGIKVDPAEVRASALRILAQYERGEEPFKHPPEDPTSAS